MADSHCDNQVVVACLRTRSSRNHTIMHLVFIEAHVGCHLQPVYIDTKKNHLADDLSRDNLPSFLSKVPGASPHPPPIPHPLLSLLLDPQADWVSPLWRTTIFSEWSSPIHTEDLWGRHELFPWLLYNVSGR